MNDATADRAAPANAELPPYAGIALANVTLVCTETLADAARGALLAADAVGFDTESKPTFVKGEASTGPHLVQFATDGHAWLFPTSLPSGVAVLKAVLESPHVQKIGFGLGNDCSALKSRLGIVPRKLLDLGEVLRDSGHRGTVGAKTAVARFFGRRLQKSKRTGTSNWASPRLSERQMLYAANDAQVALRVFRAWQQEAGRQAPFPGRSPPEAEQAAASAGKEVEA